MLIVFALVQLPVLAVIRSTDLYCPENDFSNSVGQFQNKLVGIGGSEKVINIEGSRTNL